ncbi:Protein N-terminal and lysine N-methyltransferase efm7 [Taxawa tesnikishii (nom. ined.)]|nr:Protein N-terminal and lysine N-methyltransferase efm7 [Dothideales sp. JES 119]
MSDSEEDVGGALFQEPQDFYQPEKQPTFVQHRLLDGQELNLRLVGHNPLWGHHLWNAGRTIADYLEEHASTDLAGNTVLELGAGAGLPRFDSDDTANFQLCLVSAIKGATSVVVTDYPDADLIENLQYNIDHCHLLPEPKKISAVGYLWDGQKQGFDVLILADLLFNHSEHAKLVQSVQRTLSRNPSSKALVFFTPYRPWLLERDLAFFDLAREGGLTVTKVMEKVMDKVMFEEDPGDELLRRTVYGYELHWANP